ncbi:MAG TPA: GGDEF domain-containing protein [Blastocatellia bacterium]|jgi:diguanylate cyclase (GGDEF)-like protein|nr:GGDEF domain-containing protein [Blastocatellia bacterium]
MKNAIMHGVNTVIVLLLGYSCINVFNSPIDFSWIILTLLVAFSSLIGLSVPKAFLSYTVSAAFIFTSVLVYGLFPSVILAGINALAGSVFMRRQTLLANLTVQVFSIFTVSNLLTLFLGSFDQSWGATKLFAAIMLLTFMYALISGIALGVMANLTANRSPKQVAIDTLRWTVAMELSSALVAYALVQMLLEIKYYAFLISMPTVVLLHVAYGFYLRVTSSYIQDAETDSLTGLPNKRALQDSFNRLVKTKRLDNTIVVLMIDVDGFKLVNDRLGHSMGDHVLCEVGYLLICLLRRPDFLCRYGGDEFVALVSANPREIPEIIKRMQAAIGTFDFGFKDSDINIGVSIGAACLNNKYSLEELLRIADKEMYEDKFRRKNQQSNVL